VEMLGFWVLVGMSEVIGGLLSRAARFVGVAAMSASRAGTLLPRVGSRLLMPVLLFERLPFRWASASSPSLRGLCRAAPARSGSQAVTVRGRGSVKE